MTGSLSHLVREAAPDAIFDGSEKITKASLERADPDKSAEQQNLPRARSTPGPQRETHRVTIRLRPLPRTPPPVHRETIGSCLNASPMPTTSPSVTSHPWPAHRGSTAASTTEPVTGPHRG
jgi:hypothetical protein